MTTYASRESYLHAALTRIRELGLAASEHEIAQLAEEALRVIEWPITEKSTATVDGDTAPFKV